MNKRQLGSKMEQYAAVYLKQCGYRILHRNFRGVRGEIDLIAQDGIFLVFVEVKYRSTLRFGTPGAAVGEKKQKMIRRTAQYFLKEQGISWDTPVRFDVVEIVNKRIRVIKNAF